MLLFLDGDGAFVDASADERADLRCALLSIYQVYLSLVSFLLVLVLVLPLFPCARHWSCGGSQRLQLALL